jgi:hypothetical protein
VVETLEANDEFAPVGALRTRANPVMLRTGRLLVLPDSPADLFRGIAVREDVDMRPAIHQLLV